jgi:hypothetical protein
MGYITVPEGTISYTAPTDYNREGAAEDLLVFKPEDSKSPRVVIVLPSLDSKSTETVHKSMKWKITGKACKLSFTMPNGKKEKIQVPINDK